MWFAFPSHELVSDKPTLRTAHILQAFRFYASSCAEYRMKLSFFSDLVPLKATKKNRDILTVAGSAGSY